MVTMGTGHLEGSENTPKEPLAVAARDRTDPLHLDDVNTYTENHASPPQNGAVRPAP